MNSKLYLSLLFSSLLSIVNSLAINNDDIELNLNDPNLKYSKKFSSSGSGSSRNGLGKLAKWILIGIILIITIAIIICICCCLGCCACCGGSSSKQEKYETHMAPVTQASPSPAQAYPPASTPDTQNAPSAPSQPLPAYNPVYPQYGNYPPTTAPQNPYGQPMYPQL